MNIEQIAIEVADELFLGGMAVGHNPTEFLRRCLEKLAEQVDAEPVAYQSTRNGLIAKENKNPEYNVGLYTETQLIAAQQKAAEACAEYAVRGLHNDATLVLAAGIRAGVWREYL